MAQQTGGKSNNQLRFARVIFSATPRRYILGATIEKYLKSYQEVYLLTAHLLQRDIYVDYIQDGRDKVEILQKLKHEARGIMAQGGFSLHK